MFQTTNQYTIPSKDSQNTHNWGSGNVQKLEVLQSNPAHILSDTLDRFGTV